MRARLAGFIRELLSCLIASTIYKLRSPIEPKTFAFNLWARKVSLVGITGRVAYILCSIPIRDLGRNQI